MGRGRKTRRELSRGGTGLAQRLNEALGLWPGVRITPMFGRWGYFVGDHDLWLRLTRDDQTRALADSRVRPHRRFARRGWVETDLDSPADLTHALRWLRRAYLATSRPQSPPAPDE
jgi:luciferase-like monooxygenase